MVKVNKENNKYSFNNILDLVTEFFITAIKKINKILTDKKKSVVVKAIVRIVFCLLILAVLEIPFFLIGKLGLGIIYLLSTTFREVVSSVWMSVVNYSYLIFSLIVLFKVLYDMSKRKDYRIEIKESTKIGSNLYDTFCTVLKVIIAISFIPLMLVVLMLCAFLGMLICLITHGFIIISPIIIVVGLIITLCTVLSYLSNIVLFDEGGKK